MMPRFSEFFSLGLSQRQLDFVDVSNEYDLAVYVDPYAIEIRSDPWANKAAEYIRVFFEHVLKMLHDDNFDDAAELMSHLQEPQETFLGVSSGKPQGRGVGYWQSRQLIDAMTRSKAFKSGLLKDFTDMTLYVERVDRDKISDLTTNVIRSLLIEYTQEQCDLYGIKTQFYSGPPLWEPDFREWRSQEVNVPYIEDSPTILVPKYIVRRKLSINSQDFYNKQITDFLIAEHLRANTSLVRTIKGDRKVYKGDARERDPFSKEFIADFVGAHPEVLKMYKELAREERAMLTFNDDEPSLGAVCQSLADLFEEIPTGSADADRYHRLVIGTLTALFYPDLILPKKEWDIHGGRKRIDVVYTNAGETGFFAQRRNDKNMNANMVIVECKNYSSDIANPEFDQLLGRFDRNRGKFGIIACRQLGRDDKAVDRCIDAASRQQGYMIVLTDGDFIEMLRLKAELKDDEVEARMFRKLRSILA